MVDEHVKLFESIFTDFLFGNYRLLSCPSFKFRTIKIRWQNIQKYDSASVEFSLFYFLLLYRDLANIYFETS